MSTQKRHRRSRGIGLAALAGAAVLLLTASTAVEAAPRDRRDPYRGHAERGHGDQHDRWDRRHHDRWDRRHHDRRDRRHDVRRDRRHDDRWDRRDRDRWERRQRRLHARYHDFLVPRRIRHDRVRLYRDFRRERVYHRGHHHQHDVYYFPVRTRWGWELMPHVYCEGSLYGDGYIEFRGRNFGIGLRF